MTLLVHVLILPLLGAVKLSHPNYINSVFLTTFFIWESGQLDDIVPLSSLLDITRVEQTPVIYLTIDSLPNKAPVPLSQSVHDPVSCPLNIAKERKCANQGSDHVAFIVEQISARSEYAAFSKSKGHRLTNTQVAQYWMFIANILSKFCGVYRGSKVSLLFAITLTLTAHCYVPCTKRHCREHY